MVVKRRRPVLGQGAVMPMVIGITLAVGLALGALLYRVIHHHKTKLAPTPAVLAPQHPAYLPPPLKKPKGPAPGLPAATQFDFYTILPEVHRKAEAIFPRAHRKPPSEPTGHAAPGTTPGPQIIHVGGRFILQAASFPDVADANRLRAKLALRGLTSYIEKVSISGRGAFYRVRLGPLHKAALGHDRKILAHLGLKPILLREARGN